MRKYNYKILRSEGSYTKQVKNPMSSMDFLCEYLIIHNGVDLIPIIRYFNEKCIFWKSAHSGVEVRKDNDFLLFTIMEKEYQFFKREEKLKRILE